MRCARRISLTVVCLVAILAGMEWSYANSGTDKTVPNIKGNQAAYPIEFQAPEGDEWVWRLTAVTASNWKHIPGTQTPDEVGGWQANDFQTTSGFWSFAVNSENVVDWRHFQPAEFEGKLRPVGPGDGDAPSDYSFKIIAKTDQDYYLEPTTQFVGVEEGATITARRPGSPSPDPAVESNWGYQGPQGATGTFEPLSGNPSTVTFSADQPGVYTITGHSAESEFPGVDTAEVVVFLFLETQTVATIPSDRSRKTVGVGEQVIITLIPSYLSTVTWSVSGDGALDSTTGNPVIFTAHDRASSATITATYEGNDYKVTFNVVEPSNEFAVKRAKYVFPNGVQGAGMYLDITVLPTNVSFANVLVREVSGPATGIDGYFAQFPEEWLYHEASDWAGLSDENEWHDTAMFGYWGSPWSVGFFQFIIPMEWKVDGSNHIGNMPNRIQNHHLHGSDGWSEITKLGESDERGPFDL